MNRLPRRSALALIAALTAAPRALGAQTAFPIRLGASLDDGLTPVLYAQHTGLFAKHGLDVTVIPSQNGAAVAAAVAGGSIDIAKSAMMSLLTAYSHGVRFKIVAGGTIYDPKSPTDLLCVLDGSAIRGPTDLTGKTVAVGTLKSLDQLATQALIDQRGGKSASVRFIELQFSAMLTALQQSRADCASVANPILQTVLDSQKVRSIGAPYDVLGNGFLEAAWFCTADFAVRSSDAVRRFGEAFREAAAYTNSHHDETVALLSDYSKLEPDVIRKMKRDTIALGPPTPASIQPCIDAAYKYGYVDARFTATELLIS